VESSNLHFISWDNPFKVLTLICYNLINILPLVKIKRERINGSMLTYGNNTTVFSCHSIIQVSLRMLRFENKCILLKKLMLEFFLNIFPVLYPRYCKLKNAEQFCCKDQINKMVGVRMLWPPNQSWHMSKLTLTYITLTTIIADHAVVNHVAFSFFHNFVTL
jgi:hypothetical protein